jgi:hypothetical protein
MAHSEQMVDLGGPVALEETPEGGTLVVNRSSLALEGAAVVHRVSSNEFKAAWIGPLGAGASAPLAYQPWDPKGFDLGIWIRRQPASTLPEDGQEGIAQSVRRLLAHAASPNDLEPGETRLVGWTSQAVPGVEIRPNAPQQRHASLVVAHLSFGPGRAPETDANLAPWADPGARKTLGPEDILPE